MVYNHYQSRKKWNKWKEKEEDTLRKLQFNEDKIEELRKYDNAIFKKERNFLTNENITSDEFFKIQPSQ